MSCARAAGVLILGCLCVTPVCAQRDGCQHRTIPVSTGSKDGAPAPPLSSANFEGAYQKKPVRVTSAVINGEPPRVVLLLDASASMHGSRSKSDWNFAVDLGEDVLAGMPPTSEIGLAFFATKSVSVANPTSERQKLKDKLEALRTDFKALVPGPGHTALWDAILDSFKMLDRPHLGDAIYVITDGGDEASNITTKHVARTLGEAGVRLFAFVLQKDSARTNPEELVGPENVWQIVDDTGGTVVAYQNDYRGVFLVPQDPALVDRSGKPTQLGSLLGSQYRQMFSFYRVDIDLPETVDKPREWKLDLVGFSKSQRDNLVLMYPHMLVPCH